MHSLLAMTAVPLRYKSVLPDLDDMEEDDFEVDFLVDEINTIGRMSGRGLEHYAKQLESGKWVDETCILLEAYCNRLTETLRLLGTMSSRTRKSLPDLSGLQTHAQKQLEGQKPANLPPELVKCFNWKAGSWEIPPMLRNGAGNSKKSKKKELVFSDISKEVNQKGIKKVVTKQTDDAAPPSRVAGRKATGFINFNIKDLLNEDDEDEDEGSEEESSY
ncbi:MAG: hypothetical protein KVP17_005304 [Porospora cf. gigantea B]|uniref:uncharacterized protein n=1 Tax=Porospora cf. gigantea B TaxID=2853592 RepID=UPI003571D910|nr:MAG: hypothetical protein KVP17_005304 [Porospora cf. gigantea B]